MSPGTGNRAPVRKRIEVCGIVQGVGFRPFVYALASRLGLSGLARNHSSGVTIEVQGAAAVVEEFLRRLPQEVPPLCRLEEIHARDQAPVEDDDRFVISESQAATDRSTPVSPDVATCPQCLAEMNDPRDRRYRYPFINCTNCGPRYTIVRDIPYDRRQTTMQAFLMCRRCQAEYDDPACRRFHAQPNACPECGPTVWFVPADWFEPPGDAALIQRPGRWSGPPVDSESPIESGPTIGSGPPVGQQAIAAFHRAIDQGGVLAVKGIGGFHLACDATRDEAVAALRNRKGRAEKPLAVMVRDVSAAREIAQISAEEEGLLCSLPRPIVLLRRRPNSVLSRLVAPENDQVGIMLPYSPLHHLIARHGPLVMTSGNLHDEPIVRTNREAADRLSRLVDGFLFHDRDIHVVCDDSVVREFRAGELPIRRSRGYAPMPIRLPVPAPVTLPEVLAVGGELKATFCLTKDRRAYLSPHIGDMENLETLTAFHRSVEHLTRLFRVTPRVIACDLHPGYLSTRWARERARDAGVPLFEVQHHHAHIASVLAEHGVAPDQTVIGVSFDGTGYGTDGAIWGGEILLASARDFERWGHLRYVPLPGGDLSSKFPFRSALAHLWAADLPWDERLPCVAHCTAAEQSLIRRQLERNVNCFRSSSMGRLFDAVAALTGVRQSVSYEAQAAMRMEALAEEPRRHPPYGFAIQDGECRQIDPTATLEAIVRDVIAGVSTPVILARFHHTVARMVFAACEWARNESNVQQVALSGGVFQNVKLASHAVEGLLARGFQVLYHRWVPPNDAGLALGQAYVAATRLGIPVRSLAQRNPPDGCTNSP